MPHSSAKDGRRWVDGADVQTHGAGDSPPRNESSQSSGGRADILSAAAESSTYTEFYSPIPEGYRKGFHKYVMVLGTVMSGLGKGIFASSVAKMLKDKG